MKDFVKAQLSFNALNPKQSKKGNQLVSERNKFEKEQQLALKVMKCAWVLKMKDTAITVRLKIPLFKVKKIRKAAEEKYA